VVTTRLVRIVSVVSLYAAFGDKHQLFLRALRGYTDGGHGFLRKKLNSAARALDALRACRDGAGE
jgi:hypothetical protein